MQQSIGFQRPAERQSQQWKQFPQPLRFGNVSYSKATAPRFEKAKERFKASAPCTIDYERLILRRTDDDESRGIFQAQGCHYHGHPLHLTRPFPTLQFADL